MGRPAPAANPVLRLTPWSVVRAVVLLGATLLVLGVLGASTRVIGWLLAAAILAALLHPVVELLDRRLPRGLSLAIVMVGSLTVVGLVSYAVVDEVARQIGELQTAVPEAAEDIERSERFGEMATELAFADRARDFVDELPERLRGGEVDEALRSAATRGVAFLATTVLTVFFLLHGARLASALFRQLPDRLSERARTVTLHAYRRSWQYVAGSLGMATVAGAIAYVCADVLDLPGAAPLALWVAAFDLIPIVGVVLGAAPLVLLAATTSPWEASVAVTAVLIGWQLFEALRVQRRVERRSLHVGPFVTLVVAMVALELYGVGGVFVGLALMVFVAALLDETLGHGPRSAAGSGGEEPATP